MKKTLFALALLTSTLGFAHTHVDFTAVFHRSATHTRTINNALVFEENQNSIEVTYDFGTITFRLLASNEEAAVLELSIKHKDAEGDLKEVRKPVFKLDWNKEACLRFGEVDHNNVPTVEEIYRVTIRKD